jgi:hypothetical protein
MEPSINRKCDFSQVEQTFAEYPCTPVLTREHEDVIRINAPEEVVFIPHGERALGEDTNFIVCATMRMRTETLAKLGLYSNEVDSVMFVAVDAKSNKTYSGPIARLGTSIPMPEDLKTPMEPGYVIGESFNPNLVTSFALPPVETDYYVHAVLGPFKSNVLLVRLRRAK